MAWFWSFLCAIFVAMTMRDETVIEGAVNQNQMKAPTVTVVLLARNKEHTLPYFLTLFEMLQYPKNRISLFIRSDHNEDKTIDILQEWLKHNGHHYHSTNVKLIKDSPKFYADEAKATHWSDERFDSVIKMKEEGLALAKKMWADYVWFLDMDVFLTRSDILHVLMDEDKAVISPMLNSLATYSNYWGGMTEDFWYTRTDDYIPILDRKEKGCFSVPMVHSCVLVDLTRVASDNLTFTPEKVRGYTGPKDDIITFAISARDSEIEMYVCNSEIYGFIPPPLDEEQHLSLDYKQLLSIKLEVLVEHPPLPVSQLLSKYVPPLPKKSKIGFDEIYLISLGRRPERRQRMNHSFDELGIDVKLFEAVDGKKLNESYLRQLGVQQMVDYKDPWSKRDMTFGEIGCFLSHYFIWVDIVNNGYEKVLLFEDDIRFEPYFKEKVKHLVQQADRLLDWELIYLGRKKLKSSDEPWVEDSDMLVHVDYSYWTLCYVITLNGAKKLLAGQPLGKLVPVDEYIPIMFNKHPETDWMEKFSNRDLNAFSASPLLVYPTHYTGENGYISDTEESQIVEEIVARPSVKPDLETKAPELEVGLNGLAKDEL